MTHSDMAPRTYKCRNILVLFLLFVLYGAILAVGQNKISGIVIDASTGKPLPYVAVHYEGKTIGTTTDDFGKYTIVRQPGARLSFSCVGYESRLVDVTESTIRIDIKLNISEKILGTATVKAKRKKYSRKDNPAVALMQRVIQAKTDNDLHHHEYFSYQRYQKMTFAINDFTEEVFDDEKFKKIPYLKDHVEVCPETGKLILPLSLQESSTRHIFRNSPRSEKDIIEAERETGLNQFFNTGDILNTMLEDCFNDVDIYQDNVRLLQHPFISPISSSRAIGFYRYFIVDTVNVGNDRCIEVSFTPNNPQDFGFMGVLYVTADSSYRIRRVELKIPKRSDVNFVEDLSVNQEFERLPTGEQVVVSDRMTVQLRYVDDLTKFQVQRTTHYADYSLTPIPAETFKFAGLEYIEPNAKTHDETYWASLRPEQLTKSEADIPKLVNSVRKTNGFGFILFIAKAFIENFVETSPSPDKPSKVDIGPVNTIISTNYIDGLRLRASAQTTANFNKHLFLKGYAAYGFRDHRWKGLGEVTYSFNPKEYLPREYPMHHFILSYQSDVMAPTDKYLSTDKDNVFTTLKITKVDQMNYFQRAQLKYQKEWRGGLRVDATLKRETDKACGALFYQRLDGNGTPSADPANHLEHFHTTDVSAMIHYEPGAKYVNTKQRRFTANKDAPTFELSHTLGLNGVMGGRYNYNFTEGHIAKRFWIPSAGFIDMDLKGGVLWNRVPYPLLIMPAADLSYVMQRATFSMLGNMEFLNDRYASLFLSWDMNGKLFNRVPLLKRLKLREYLGFNMLWGDLSNKNNPYLNPDDDRLFYFPGHFLPNGTFESSSYLMDSATPYCEAIFGVSNIFKILHVQMVRRLNYLDNPHAKKWGFRFKLTFTF